MFVELFIEAVQELNFGSFLLEIVQVMQGLWVFSVIGQFLSERVDERISSGLLDYVQFLFGRLSLDESSILSC